MRWIFVSIILITLLSCHQGDRAVPEAVMKIEVDLNHAGEVLASELFSDFHFVNLKTPENVHFGHPDKVTIQNDRIYIMDIYQALKVLVFDLEGNFIYEISRYGRGPGEFISPRDFLVDEENDVLAILDQGELKVSLFELSDGTFIQDYHLDFMPDKFSKIKDGYVFFNNNLTYEQDGKYYNVFFTDHEFNTTYTHLEIPKDQIDVHFGLSRNFTFQNNELFLAIPFHNKIYSIIDDHLFPYLEVDFGNFNLPENFFQMYRDRSERRIERERYAFNVTNFFESDDYLFFSYNYNESIYFYFSSKKTGNIYNVRRDLFHFDNGIEIVMGWPLEMDGNNFVWYQQPYNLKGHLEEVKENMSENEWREFQQKNNKLVELNESIEYDDNAYLIFTKLDF